MSLANKILEKFCESNSEEYEDILTQFSYIKNVCDSTSDLIRKSGKHKSFVKSEIEKSCGLIEKNIQKIRELK